MIHERYWPPHVRRDLWLVYRVKLYLLKWLLVDRPMLVETQFEARWGDPLGAWLWSRVWWRDKKTKYGLALDALKTAADASPIDAESVWEAILHDACFGARWNDPGFRFRFPDELESLRDAVKPVAIGFYDWLVDMGFAREKFGVIVQPELNRREAVRAQRRAYRPVCTYCDGEAGDITDETVADQVDHFFPKEMYPHLALHPDNLCPACPSCNQSWKGAKPPCELEIGMLANTYHPSLCPGAGSCKVDVKRAGGKVKVSVTDVERAHRAQNMNRMLDLDGRWTGRANEALRDMCSAYADALMRQDTRPTGANARETVEARVRQRRDSDQRGVGRRANCLWQIALSEFLLANPGELKPFERLHP